MANRRRKKPGPRFPRKTWSPGQKPLTVPPKKGKGSSYDRDHEARETRKEIAEDA
jgi:hypothetical protein